MSFKISFTEQTPDLSALPVLKVDRYPLEPRDYKPFCQTSIFIDQAGFHVRMWAFETPPEPDSTMLAVFRLFSDAASLCQLLLTPQDVSVQLGGADVTDYCTIDRFAGEDLQGVYWGACFTVPQPLLTRRFPGCRFACGGEIRGNIFKLCETGARPHFGSYFPFPFPQRAYADSSLFGVFPIVNY